MRFSEGVEIQFGDPNARRGTPQVDITFGTAKFGASLDPNGLRELRERITAPPGFASHYLDVMSKDFIARYPEVTLDLDLTHRMVDLVEENIDVAIRVTDPRDSSLVARRIAPAPIIAVAAPAYLRQRGTPKKPVDLRDHDCIVDTNFRDQQRWRFRTADTTETVTVDGPLRVNNPDAVCEMAEAGLGIALIPDFVAKEALAAGSVCEVLEGRVALSWTILAVFPRRRYLPARVRAYVDHLVERIGR